MRVPALPCDKSSIFYEKFSKTLNEKDQSEKTKRLYRLFHKGTYGTFGH